MTPRTAHRDSRLSSRPEVFFYPRRRAPSTPDSSASPRVWRGTTSPAELIGNRGCEGEGHGGARSAPVSLSLAGLDGDGDLDAIDGYSDFANSDVAWYENLTSPAVTAGEIANHLLGRVTPHPASLDVNADRVVDAADLVAVEP